MTADQLPPEIETRASILFLGSGFSAGALNINGDLMPAGRGLQEALAKELNADPAEFDLRTLAEEIKANDDFDLYNFMYKTFTTSRTLQKHDALLELGWRRIYTTNYDDVVEFYRQEAKLPCPSFDTLSDRPKKIPTGSVVHLHGSVRSATKSNIHEALVLNEQSYIRQYFERSGWYEEFERDMKFSDAIYFIGYSLSDYHISALLLANPALYEKTYFVSGEKPDAFFVKRVSRYGRVIRLGAEGFPEPCRARRPTSRAPEYHKLRAFKYVDPFKDKKAAAKPTAIEIKNLVTFGVFNSQRCLQILPDSDYVVTRRRLVDEAVDAYRRGARSLLVHSHLGNGKTIFLTLLSAALIADGYKCFFSVPGAPIAQAELAAISSVGRVAIFFDNYNYAAEILPELIELPQAVKFVLTQRTGTQEVRFFEVQDRLPAPIIRIDLNGLDGSEKDEFSAILDRAGLLTAPARKEVKLARDVREIVTAAYSNTYIRSELVSLLAEPLKSKVYRIVTITALLLRWAGVDVTGAVLRTLTGADAFAEARKYQESSEDLFSLDQGDIQVRSALFAEYVLRNLFEADEIVSAAADIVLASVIRKKERTYREAMSRLMQISNLQQLLRKRSNSNWQAALETMFDRLRRDIHVNDEPLFWLQYAILMIEKEDLNSAEQFIQTAYGRAATIQGFRTYQIDTQYLNLLLTIETLERSVSVKRMPELLKTLDLVPAMIGEERHRNYAVKVLKNVEGFVVARLGNLGSADRTALLLSVDRLLQALSNLTPEAQAYCGSAPVAASLLRAKAVILRG